MKHSLFLILIVLLFNNSANAQTKIDSINWLTTDTVTQRFAKVQKPVMFFIYTKSCDSCALMQKETFSNSEVSNYINVLFYPVKIDANTSKNIKFLDGKEYSKPSKPGAKHGIVELLSGENDSLPALVLFNKRGVGTAFYGFKNRDEIFRILIYYAEDMDLSVNFQQWYKYHTKGYPAGQEQIVTRLKIRWKELEEATELNKTQPRKTLLNFYNYYKISCTLMRTQSFNQIDIANYLNQNYYPVNIDVFSTDTLEIFGQKYINENQPYKYHQLPIAALEGNMIFPSFLILDEDGKVLIKIFKYMTPEMLEPLLKYFGENMYKKISYEEYLKTFKSEIRK